MSFFERARYAAAEQYGRDRSEAYGRRAKLGVLLGWVAIALLVMGILYVKGGPWG